MNLDWIPAGVIALLLILIVVPASCSRELPSNPPADLRSYEVGFYDVQEFRLKDGTRCVAHYKGGIDCDWEATR